MALDKKNNELQCLERVIKQKESLYGEGRKIIDKICGREFDREDAERPDFVRCCPPESEDGKGTLIGIEHFRVDRLSLQKKNGKVASTGIATEKAVNEIYEKWHDSVIKSESVPEGVVDDIAKLVAAQMQKQEQSSYNTLIKSFEYSLGRHLECVDAYRRNLQELSAGQYDIELALLIEIHSELRNLFINNQSGTYREKGNFAPIFEDMVRLMEEKVDCNKVNYIILCMGGAIFTSELKVVAVRTEDIRKQLEKQNIAIYEYAGEDLFYSGFKASQRNVECAPGYRIEGDKITFAAKYTDNELSEQIILDRMFYSLRKALAYRKQGRNFVATYGTQMVLDVLGDYVAGWKPDKHGLFPILKPVPIETFGHRMRMFSQKWQ
ncbi:hypothetical protein [Faecalibaculum rodentium]|uniref:hypothetical protein n=1 Tax=Faecalibaculum rodentium TaxID=1702221 RepID=UPI0025AC325F|nr:hypothetical protein [Faecalibaculum rodentium]